MLADRDLLNSGGAIFNRENLTITSSTLSGNAARFNGGGIDNRGTATITSSTLSGNSAGYRRRHLQLRHRDDHQQHPLGQFGASGGGGISNGGTATITSSTLSGNSADAPSAAASTTEARATITSSTLSGNSAGLTAAASITPAPPRSPTAPSRATRQTYGGGIYNSNSGNATINNSTISGNFSATVGGGIFNSGTATITRSTITGNSAFTRGGGIYNFNGTATITSSTLSGNSALNGGGIYNTSNGTATVTSSTLSGNTARYGDGGGGIFNSGTATITSSTISDNTALKLYISLAGGGGGGIFNIGTATITRSLIAGNTAADGGEISNLFSGTVNLDAYNLIGDSSQSTVDARIGCCRRGNRYRGHQRRRHAHRAGVDPRYDAGRQRWTDPNACSGGR